MSGVGEKREGQAEDDGLSTQMAQLQLKDPSYHETSVYTTTGEDVAYTIAPSYIAASHPQCPLSHSSKHPMTTVQDQTIPPCQASGKLRLLIVNFEME